MFKFKAIIKILPLLESTRIRGITLFPFIFLRQKEYLNDKVLINHELIHIRQQAELLVIPFYILYLTDYVIQLFRHDFNDRKAYRAISFEREAKKNEKDMDYLKNRKWFSFIKYFNSKD